MKPKKSRLLIWGLLGVAGFLGISAVIIAILYSNIDDVTPDPTGANNVDPVCKKVIVLEKNEIDEWVEIPSDEQISVYDEVMVQGEFIGPQIEDGNYYDGFEFSIGTYKKIVLIEDQSEDLSEGIVEITTNSEQAFVTYIAKLVYSGLNDLADTNIDTISFNITPLSVNFEDELEPTNGVQVCLDVIYNLDTEADPNINYECIEEGEFAIDPCANLPEGEDEDCTPTPCCSGLERIDNCSEPDSDGECNYDSPGCYICLSGIGDGVCDTANGENICNNPDDCTTGEPQEEPDEPEPDEPEPDEPEPDEPEPDEPEPDEPEPDEPTETSNFEVSLEGPSCVERIAPNNEVTFTISVKNNDDSYEEILQVKDKLPLGFEYVENSSIINTLADQNDSFVRVNSTGNTQELIWSVEDGWSVNSNDTFTIEFRAIAGDNAITGEVQNEVVVTPLNTPNDSTKLRTEFVMTVAQTCETPDTSIIGNSWIKIALGFIVILFSFYLYTSSRGSQLAANIERSKALRLGEDLIDGVSGIYTKATDPRKHLENKISKKDDRR